MHPVVMCCYNNLELTKVAVASVLAQDIPVQLWIVDNGSTDGTREWLQDLAATRPDHSIVAIYNAQNISPCRIANDLMARIFHLDYKTILGVPNDVVLPKNFYTQMLRSPRGVVTASFTHENPPPEIAEARAVNENTPMAVALVRHWVHEALVAKDGHFFDEAFFHYASDCDLALRLAAIGIRGVQLDLPYWHYGSASWRLAPAEQGRAMTAQADVDRAYFERKWGFRVDDPEYGASAGDLNFRG